MRIIFNQNNIKMEKLRYNLYYTLANIKEKIKHENLDWIINNNRLKIFYFIYFLIVYIIEVFSKDNNQYLKQV